MFHLAEMLFAMFAGMAGFLLVRSVATGQGYTALLDVSSIDFQLGMATFMAVPMVALMRFRGCRWRDCGAMCAAMLLPTAAVVGFRGFQLREAQIWFATNQHMLMLVGMLVAMLYRREHYTNGYSFVRWSTTPRRRQVISA